MGLIADIIYFVIVIGIIVVFHEFGHFISARLSGMRADVFSVGMGPRLFGFNKKTGFSLGRLPKDYEHEGETDYRVAAFPIGGYVKIAGMVDESMDTNYAGSEPQPWEFRSKNTFQKSITLAGGAIMNAVLAILIFTAIAFFQGKSLYKTTEVGYVDQSSLAYETGFREGDKILSINGNNVETWDEVLQMLTLDDFGESRDIKLRRDGEIKTIHAEGKAIIKTMADRQAIGLQPAHIQTQITQVLGGRPAAEAGMQAGDVVTSVNEVEIDSYTEFIDIVSSHAQTPVFIEWQRNGEAMSASITPDENGMIGVGIGSKYTGPKEHVNYGVGEALVFGVDETIRAGELFISTISQIISGNISFRQSIGGPIQIAASASQQAEMGIINFLGFVALLSITLGIINILPFPALDGGHLVFVLIEGIIRREVPLKIKMGFQQFGIIILLMLMAFTIYNDIVR
ncbi:MAG: RIP metalloprotease RseP [Candidatus Kapaibacterium sp.]